MSCFMWIMTADYRPLSSRSDRIMSNIERKDMLLYAVTDRSWLREETLASQVEKALRGGVTLVQLREKSLTADIFIQEAIEIGKLCREYHVPFIVNDDVNIAVQADADGVHVGQDDMAAGSVRKRLGSNKIIGVSAHSVEEALEAERNGADYLGVGAVFGSSTKTDANALDHGVLKEICRAVSIPVVAIGGVNEKNISKLAGTGISGVAVVSAIFAKEDIEAAAKNMRILTEKIVSEYQK